MIAKHIVCPEHGHVGTIHDREPTCSIQMQPGKRCAKPCTVELQGDENEADLEEARGLYFSLGGTPSASTTPRKAPWYWRRAAKMMRALRELQVKRLGIAVARIDKATFAHGDTIGEHSDEFNDARLDICKAIDAAGGRGTR